MAHPHDLIFGALAVRAGVLRPRQLDDALAEPNGGESVGLAERLRARGWLSDEQRSQLEAELAEHLRLHGDDTDATLADMSLLSTGDGISPDGPESGGPALQEPAGDHPTNQATIDENSTIARIDKPKVDSEADFGDSAPSAVAREVTITSDPGLVLIGALGAPPETATTRYSFSHLHATGGVGQVWLARDTAMGREVAVKELKAEQTANPGAWARFLDEARITGQLEHPGIVPVYELGTRPSDRHPFYTMRFVRGRTLTQGIRAYHLACKAGTDDPLALRGLLNAFVSICNTIAYAHSRGVIHRDIKSHNVVLGDFGEVMVLDWGLAKLVGQPQPHEGSGEGANGFDLAHGDQQGHTVAGQIMGTPAYMAPEQASGEIEKMDVRTDVYGLGAILYEILTGQPPIDRAEIKEMLRRIKEDPPVPPRSRVAGTPPALQAVCLKALNKRSEDRYPSAQELADEVARWLADEPVEAYPEPWTKKLARWAKKHRSAVAAAAVVLATTLVGLAVGYVLVRRERDEANHQRLIASQQRDEAGRQREVARSAVNEMYTDVAELWLEDNLDTTQNKFLERALAYYETFAGQDESRPEIYLERVRALRRVGEIERKLGRTDEAERSFTRALAELDGLSPGAASAPDAALERGRILSRKSGLHGAQNQYEEAAALEMKALAALEPLARAEGPATPAIELARLHRTRAERLRNQRKNDAALVAYRSALATVEPAANRYPDDFEARKELALCLEGLGLLQSELRTYDEARPTLEKALALQKPLVEKFPTIPRFRSDLATTSDTLGRLLIDVGDSGEAERQLNTAIGHYERLSNDFPERLEYRRALSRGRVNLGTLLQAQGDFESAEQLYRGAISELTKLAERDPNMPKFRRDLGIVWGNLGELFKQRGELAKGEQAHAKAVANLTELVQKNPETPDYRGFLSLALNNWAQALDALGRHEEAERAYRQAIDRLENLVHNYPEDLEYQESLARCLGDLGVVLARTQRPEPAEGALRQALAMCESLNRPEPRTPTARQSLIVALSNLGELPYVVGRQREFPTLRLPERESLTRRAFELSQTELQDHPKSPRVGNYLASTADNLGEILVLEGSKSAEAAEMFALALREFEALAAKTSPTGSLEVRQSLARVQTNLGNLLLAEERPAEAQTLLEKATANARSALVGDTPAEARDLLIDAVSGLGRSLLALGRFGRTGELAADLGRTLPGEPLARVEAARLLTRSLVMASADTTLPEERRLPLTRALGDRAVAQLRVAAESGLSDFEKIQTEPVFDPLRERDDFRALLADVRNNSGAVKE
jgi:serine/threonine-protein kinase